MHKKLVELIGYILEINLKLVLKYSSIDMLFLKMKITSCLRGGNAFIFKKLLNFSNFRLKWFSTFFHFSSTNFEYILFIAKLKISNKLRTYLWYYSIFLFCFMIKNKYLCCYFPVMKEFMFLRIRSLTPMLERTVCEHVKMIPHSNFNLHNICCSLSLQTSKLAAISAWQDWKFIKKNCSKITQTPKSLHLELAANLSCNLSIYLQLLHYIMSVDAHAPSESACLFLITITITK